MYIPMQLLYNKWRSASKSKHVSFVAEYNISNASTVSGASKERLSEIVKSQEEKSRSTVHWNIELPGYF